MNTQVDKQVGKQEATYHPMLPRRDFPSGRLAPSRQHKLSVVSCLQWGSTGKGNVVARLVEDTTDSYSVIGVRVGGPNAGHTFEWANGQRKAVQTIPIPPFVSRTATGYIGAAGMVHRNILEVEWHALCEMYAEMGWGWPRLAIDRHATIITDEHMRAEADLKARISSTGEGVGAATAERVMRRAPVVTDDADFMRWLDDQGIAVLDTVTVLNRALLREGSEQPIHVIAEGTQGALLSLYTGGYYPYCTSRECTPDALLSQMGLTSRHAADLNIVGVMRTYPIRVGGPSGPLPREITWEELRARTGGYVSVPEKTTVTKKTRRIAELDLGIMRRVVAQTRPTSLAVTFLDYMFPSLANAETLTDVLGGQVGDDVIGYLARIEEQLGTPICMVGTGPVQHHYVGMPGDWNPSGGI